MSKIMIRIPSTRKDCDHLAFLADLSNEVRRRGHDPLLADRSVHEFLDTLSDAELRTIEVVMIAGREHDSDLQGIDQALLRTDRSGTIDYIECKAVKLGDYLRAGIKYLPPEVTP